MFKENYIFKWYTPIMRVICVLVFLNSCSTIRKTSQPSIVDFDDVGFFTDENKPDTYQLKYPQNSPSSVSVNDRDDVVSGEKGAIAQTELKIREHAVTYGYNGVILGKLSHYTVVNGHDTSPVTYYTQTYIPIIYDQEKYQAPLTDYQRLKKKRLSSVPQADLLSIHDEYNTNGHEYVDLGLSVLWATCNIGAESPEGYGDYFAWGETLPKSDYSLKTYKWCNGEMYTYTKYCDDREYGADGFVDTLKALEKDDDPAIAQWGGDWRMPSQLEFEELFINSTREWIQVNGINGYRFTSNVPGYEGKSIFIPCSGLKRKEKLLYANELGRYWSSDFYAHGQNLRFGNVKPVSSIRNTDEASIIKFDESLVFDGTNLKVEGLPVRAVIKVNGKGFVMP